MIDDPNVGLRVGVPIPFSALPRLIGNTSYFKIAVQGGTVRSISEQFHP